MERAHGSTTRNEQLAAIRIERGLSQERLAELVGVDRVTVQRWEQGKNFPQPYCLERLCAILGKTAS